MDEQASSDLFSITGRRILITGASSGLGRHFATMLGARGARLALAARREDALAATIAQARAAGAPEAVALSLDVTDENAVARELDRAVAELGGIDVVINNAGIAAEGAAVAQTPIDFDRVMDTNLRGAWLTATAIAKIWIAAGQPGTIVNIASILGLRVASHVAPYAISKAGLVQMTRVLALEWARYGIRVNALAPGYIATEINSAFFATEAGKALIKRIPQRRLGQPSDLDGALLLLVSNASAFMTGAVIPVDGGHLVTGL
jgi:NAD(P)-dependent dehydrogenase (short-subunit alcohol dehydrogenase family)